jgi:hypothetical protein
MSRTPTCAKILSSNFTYVKDPSGFGGVFTIERSTLDSLGGLQQIYGQTGSIGFIMISAKTGLEAEFRLTSLTTDRDGDVTCWKLSPTFSSYNQAGGRQLQHVAVHVYNT